LLDQANGTAKISILCLGMNLLLSLILVFRFKQAGLGAANSLTSFLKRWCSGASSPNLPTLRCSKRGITYYRFYALLEPQMRKL
jgi:hypothetical protein